MPVLAHQINGPVYVSGPMGGLPDYNFPAFHEAAQRLMRNGFRVINPADNFGGYTGHPRRVYMRLDISHVLDAAAVAVLPGWQDSRGARLEVEIARQLDLPVYDALTMEPVPCSSDSLV